MKTRKDIKEEEEREGTTRSGEGTDRREEEKERTQGGGVQRGNDKGVKNEV